MFGSGSKKIFLFLFKITSFLLFIFFHAKNAVVDLDMLDGIVCDMILKCDECLRIMKPLIAKLKSGGFLVLTLKLFAT